MKNQAQKPANIWILRGIAVILAAVCSGVFFGCATYQKDKAKRALPPAEKPVCIKKPLPDRRYVYAGNPKPMPSFPCQIHVLTNIGYAVGYCEERKDPAWVAYRLFKVNSLQAPERPSKFITDIRTQAKVSPAGYTGSGYDRGHMAPNYAIAVCYGQQAQLETFLMSNIIPQKPKLNRGIWKNLEQIEIRKYAQEMGEIWVLTGGIFEGNDSLKSGVCIPSKCYKILVDEVDGKPRILAFIIEQNVNGSEDLDYFLTSVDAIEQKTGLDFLAELPDDVENTLESQTAEWLW